MSSEGRTITVPYITGDGIGPEIMDVAKAVTNAAVHAVYDGKTAISWAEVLAGERSFKATGDWMPRSTLDAIKSSGVALKGPLTTPVGGGIRSLNVLLRQRLDLYASVRPVRHFEGVPSPVKEPQKMNIVIFRENTEDVYRGIEWSRGSKEALELADFLEKRMGIKLPPDSGIGIKPISEAASKRLVRAAINHALKKGLRSVTLVHKGNIMKFTEGAFKSWGYEVASGEFSANTISESEMVGRGLKTVPSGKILINDRIADNMFQQILTRPEEYSVLAAPNLNGDYLADACAAQVGGLGIAPGANIGDEVAVFEAVHGTAPKYAGKDLANPCSLILSSAMMLEHLGLVEASGTIERAVARTLSERIFTQDIARMSPEPVGSVGTSRFGDEIIRRLA
jgi:isocitrate dehydrogenase